MVSRVNNSDKLEVQVEMTPEMFSDNLSQVSSREKELVDALKAMLGICQRLGAETRYHPEHRYFTAMVWTGWDTPCGMGEALAVQQKIQRIAAQYPAVVCYCFDPFSTLVYTV